MTRKYPAGNSQAILTADFCEYFREQIRQLLEVAYVVNIIACNFVQLVLKFFIFPDTDSKNPNAFGLQDIKHKNSVSVFFNTNFGPFLKLKKTLEKCLDRFRVNTSKLTPFSMRFRGHETVSI